MPAKELVSYESLLTGDSKRNSGQKSNAVFINVVGSGTQTREMVQQQWSYSYGRGGRVNVCLFF